MQKYSVVLECKIGFRINEQIEYLNLEKKRKCLDFQIDEHGAFNRNYY